MARIDKNISADGTIAIFDSFYGVATKVDSSQYDLVYSFFYNTSKNKTVAGNFTVILFRIAQETNINITTLLNELRGVGTEKLKVNKTMAYYLNSLKSKTSLYGVAAIPLPNLPVARNVVI